MNLQCDGQMGSVPGSPAPGGGWISNGHWWVCSREGVNGKAGRFPALPCL